MTPTNWNSTINRYDPVCEFTADRATIPSRRKFAYPPVPPPRSPLPSRRRVSFCDVVFGDTRGSEQNRTAKMQDTRRRPCYSHDSNEECDNTYDIWQADDSVGKQNGGYENLRVSRNEDIGGMHFEKSASECCDVSDDAMNKCNDMEKNCGQDRCAEGSSDSRAYRTMNDKDEVSSREDAMTYNHHNGPCSSNEFDDNERLRGGCGGGPCGSRPKVTCGVVKVIENPCHCGKSKYNIKNQ